MVKWLICWLFSCMLFIFILLDKFIVNIIFWFLFGMLIGFFNYWGCVVVVISSSYIKLFINSGILVCFNWVCFDILLGCKLGICNVVIGMFCVFLESRCMIIGKGSIKKIYY